MDGRSLILTFLLLPRYITGTNALLLIGVRTSIVKDLLAIRSQVCVLSPCRLLIKKARQAPKALLFRAPRVLTIREHKESRCAWRAAHSLNLRLGRGAFSRTLFVGSHRMKSGLFFERLDGLMLAGRPNFEPLKIQCLSGCDRPSSRSRSALIASAKANASASRSLGAGHFANGSASLIS